MKQTLTVEGLTMVFNLPQLIIQNEDVDIKLTGGELDANDMGDYTIAFIIGIAEYKRKSCEFILEVSLDDYKNVDFHAYVSSQLDNYFCSKLVQHINNNVTVDFDRF